MKIRTIGYQGTNQIVIDAVGLMDKPVDGTEVICDWTIWGYQPREVDLPDWFFDKFALDDDGCVAMIVEE